MIFEGKYEQIRSGKPSNKNIMFNILIFSKKTTVGIDMAYTGLYDVLHLVLQAYTLLDKQSIQRVVQEIQRDMLGDV